jgi:formamidopyrimidine-DNA glycosylase
MPDRRPEHPAMPELPEVETVRAGVEALLSGSAILHAEPHRSGLRQPFGDLSALSGPVRGVRRRAKYLLIETTKATLLSHLGMTGSWRVADSPRTHDHLTLHLADGRRLVFNDPRRFGLAALLDGNGDHPLLAELGPEPLDPAWNGAVLHRALRGRKAAIKALIMDQQVVVGVGNIYAQEALFRSAIRPQRPAGRLDRGTCDRLVDAIRNVLQEAIAAGGSTISDFVHAGGGTGLFQHRFRVYGRGGQPCAVCATAIRRTTIAGRTTCWCPRCQR